MPLNSLDLGKKMTVVRVSNLTMFGIISTKGKLYLCNTGSVINFVIEEVLAECIYIYIYALLCIHLKV